MTLTSTSPSQLTKFNPAEDGGCNLRWYFNSVLKQKEPEKEAQKTGTQAHAQLEHWGKTGEDVLGVVAKAIALHVPPPNPTHFYEWGFHDRPKYEGKNYFPPEQSLLRIACVPLIGFIDRIVPPGEDGIAEVIDYKTTKNFKWVKPGEVLFKTTQMASYAAWVTRKFPDLSGVRLTHVYGLVSDRKTFDPEGAKKSSIVVSLDEIKSREVELESLVTQMDEVGRAKKAEEVKPNLGACGDFGGCPFQSTCWAYKQTKPIERIRMGLREKVRGMNGVTAVPPPVDSAPKAEAPRRLTIQDESTTPDVKPLEQGAAYLLPGGILGVFNCMTTGKNSFVPASGGTPILLDRTVPVQKLDVKLPEPAKTVEAPKVEAKVETPKADAPPRPKFGMKLTMKKPESAPETPKVEAKPAPAKVEAPKVEAKTEPVAEPAKEEVPAEAPKKRGRPKKTEQGETEAETASGIQLFVNCIPNRPYKLIDGYVWETVKMMQEEFNVEDIRSAPDSVQNLAFGRWRGVLATVIKQCPPEAGAYVAFSKGSEIMEISVEALSGLCLKNGILVRGL